MADVWTMARLLGKTAIEVKDDYQVTLLVLASMSLKPKPEPEPGQTPTVAEAVSAMSGDDRMLRVVAGITRLCEPFQQALARMPLEKLAPANEAEARQRLFEVVDQELDRIGQFREMHQKIADADLAEAPVRLAFETSTEGDRGRRYILSYERLINRRIDTFLKVRKASATGELDFVELAEAIGTEELAELAKAAGGMADKVPGDLGSDDGGAARPEPGDLRSADGRGRETGAQHGETCAHHTYDSESVGISAERI
jgi:hypothetical protein